MKTKNNYIHVDDIDSHFFTDLKQILESIRLNQQIDFIKIKIENSLKNNYNIAEYCDCKNGSLKGHCHICDNDE